jgi:hypothetical protein
LAVLVDAESLPSAPDFAGGGSIFGGILNAQSWSVIGEILNKTHIHNNRFLPRIPVEPNQRSRSAKLRRNKHNKSSSHILQ